MPPSNSSDPNPAGPTSLAESVAEKDNNYLEADAYFYQETGCRLHETACSLPLPEKAPGLSVIIPCHNVAKTIPHVLEALNQQSLPAPSVEIVIVDDASSDGTFEQIQKLASAMKYSGRVIRHENRLGRGQSRNTGASFAKNDLLLFLDGDVVATRWLLQSHVLKHSLVSGVLITTLRVRMDLNTSLTAILKSNDFDFLLSPDGDWRFKDKLKQTGESFSCIKDTNYFCDFGYGRQYYGKTLPEMALAACMSVRREDFFRVGGFLERFTGYGYEDIFFGCQAINRGLKIVPDLNVLCHLNDGHELQGCRERMQEHSISAALYAEMLKRSAADLENEAKADLLKAGERGQVVLKWEV